MEDNVQIRSGFGPMPLSKQLNALTKNLVGKRGFANADLLLHWSDVIGEDLAKGVKPDKITYPKNTRENAILHVRVGAGSFAVVIEHQKKVLLDRINTFLGFNAISDIKIKQDLIEIESEKENKQKERILTIEEEKQLSEKLKDIKEDDLKKKLHEIGKLIFFK